MPIDPDLASAISTIPAQYGVDPGYIQRMAVVESGGNLGAKAATSSAAGPYQIIGSTADALGINRADRYDPTIATDAISRFTRDNATGLQKAGFDTTNGNLYLSHFAGLGGAKSVLGADPTTPVSALLPSSSISANPFLRGMTAGDLTAWADRKMSGGSAMQMPASTGGAARPAGLGLGGPQQQAQPPLPMQSALAPQAAPPGVPAAEPSAQGTGTYGEIEGLLKGLAPRAAAQGQQQGGGGGGGSSLGGMSPGGQPMDLGQARQQFDARRFFSLLPRRAGGAR
jgi:hypothetical protein